MLSSSRQTTIGWSETKCIKKVSLDSGAVVLAWRTVVNGGSGLRFSGCVLTVVQDKEGKHFCSWLQPAGNDALPVPFLESSVVGLQTGHVKTGDLGSGTIHVGVSGFGSRAINYCVVFFYTQTCTFGAKSRADVFSNNLSPLL